MYFPYFSYLGCHAKFYLTFTIIKLNVWQSLVRSMFVFFAKKLLSNRRHITIALLFFLVWNYYCIIIHILGVFFISLECLVMGLEWIAAKWTICAINFDIFRHLSGKFGKINSWGHYFIDWLATCQFSGFPWYFKRLNV